MSPTQPTILYDDGCPLCVCQIKLLNRLDWLNRLVMMPISDPRAATVAPGVSREELLKAIHCVTPGGKIHRGARCIRYLGMRLPLLLPLTLLLWLPEIIQVAEIIYQYVSRNRLRASRLFGCRQACSIASTHREKR